jgi:two-component system alkaline phosphatase synthesis response regulator PhoP
VPEVLIVDDDPDVRGMLAFTLGDEGFQVREAKDGEDALEELRARTPDCVVLDLMMPRLDGFKVLETMRAEQLAVGTPVIVFSCKSEERTFVRVWELGADDYLTKPVDPDVVAHKILALLEAGTPTGRPGA